MRLTILNQFYTPDISPTAHLSASLAAHRAARGDQVTVVASRGGYVPASEDERRSDEGNPRIHRVWTPRLGKASILKRCADYAVFYLLATWRLLTLPQQDVIVSLTTPPYIAWAAVLHKWLHGSGNVRVVLWNMDCYPDAAERLSVLKPGSVPSRIMRWLNRRLFAQLDHLVCLDTAMVDLLLSQYGPKDARGASTLPTTIIPNWENASFFPSPLDAPGEPRAPRARSSDTPGWSKAPELDLDNKFVLLYLGNTGYGHQFETALDAAHALRDEPVTFLFVGGGSRWTELAAVKNERGLDNVVLHGYVPKDQTPSVMASAHCALITLRDIALGVMSPSKLHANLAAALPVLYIGPEASNVDDAIRQFECGVSVRHGDASGVVAFVRRMLADRAAGRGAFESLRARARRAFDEAYCDSVTLPAFDRVIDAS